MKRRFPILLLLTLLAGCANPAPKAAPLRGEVDAFLSRYTTEYQRLYALKNEADWATNIRIVEGDTTRDAALKVAAEAQAAFVGSAGNIETARRYLARSGELDSMEIRQLKKVLFLAADQPQTIAAIVKARIAAEAEQTTKMYGFNYTLDGHAISTNEIDDALSREKNLARRRAIWEASKEVGPALKPGLITLRQLRNETVQALGYSDYFGYKAAEYGLSGDQLTALVDGVNRDLRPLYRELHTWARYELAKRYHQPVPDRIPAHWLPNRWGQDWGTLVSVAGIDLDQALKGKEPEWLVKQGERFYRSIGFPPLPASFWEKSSLYPPPPGADWKKNNHASAWHMDLDQDVRCLMSVEPNREWYDASHHELGHIYYYLSYSRPEVPILLRDGADRAYHEAIGSMMGLAAQQPRFLQAIGVTPKGEPPDSIQALLAEALDHVVFIPWSAGTMFHFEKELYADSLPPERWNERWWELAAEYQGIEPPAPRGEEWCDAATKTHINDYPAAYYDYALAEVLLFQLHDHIAKKILHENPRDTNYYGRKEVGDFLVSILSPGATVDGQELLEKATGSRLTAQPMADYFAPLLAWLKEQNKGRIATLPEIPAQ